MPRPARRSPCPSPARRAARAPRATLLTLLACSLLAGLAHAAGSLSAAGRWSEDPARNLRVAGGPGDQVQPKLVADGLGGFYLSWYDGGAGGYDPTLQRLDAAGNARGPAAGLKLADTSFSWVTDYGLAVDSEGAALVAFRDDRGGEERVTATRVLQNGTLAWGGAGRSYSQPAGFVGPPKVAGAADGAIYLAWAEDERLRLARLDSGGALAWAEPLTLEDPDGAALWLADLQATPDGGCILSWVRSASFTAPRHLYAQRFDAQGAALWGEAREAGGRAPVAVFTAGSLQMGNFPPFLPDGAGGAVFAWYEVEPLQVRVQRLRPDGSRVFAEDGGLAGGARPDLERVEPALAYAPVGGETYLFWRETPVAGGIFQQALRGQAFDGLGRPLWGEEGREIVAMGPTEMVQLRAFAEPGGVTLAYVETLAQAQDQRLWIRRLGREGQDLWPEAPVAVSSAASVKSRLALLGAPPGAGAAASALPWAILAWEDERGGDVDLYAQSVGPDGLLGPAGPVTPPPTATGPTPSPTATPEEPTPTPAGGRVWLPWLRG